MRKLTLLDFLIVAILQAAAGDPAPPAAQTSPPAAEASASAAPAAESQDQMICQREAVTASRVRAVVRCGARAEREARARADQRAMRDADNRPGGQPQGR